MIVSTLAIVGTLSSGYLTLFWSIVPDWNPLELRAWGLTDPRVIQGSGEAMKSAKDKRVCSEGEGMVRAEGRG